MSLVKNLFLGAFAGGAATVAMTVFQNRASPLLKRVQPDQEGKMESTPTTVKSVQRIHRAITGRELPKERETLAGQAAHFGMGISMGAVFGAAFGRGSVAKGLAWGGLLWLLADELGTYAAGVAPPPWQTKKEVHAFALASHLVYGAALGGLDELEARFAA